jgi:hypothetical protein
MLEIIRSALVCLWLLISSSASGQSTAIDEPYLAEVPRACGYLTEAVAADMLRAKVQASAANEHLPTVWSQCIYAGRGVVGRNVHFTFKYMLHELTDVAKLDPVQLNFNVSFAMRGIPPSATLKDLGKISFAFEKKDLTVLMVVTGIQGPLDGAGRASELIATYQFSDPDTPHAERLDRLLPHARSHLQEWLARARPPQPR